MAANPKKVSHHLSELSGGLSWRLQRGQYCCPLKGRSSAMVQELLNDAYGLGFTAANGVLAISARKTDAIMGKETVFPTMDALIAAGEAAIKSRSAAQAEAAPEATPALEAETLTDAKVVEKLRKFTHLSWSPITDGGSHLAGQLATPPTTHKLAEQQLRMCHQKGLKTTRLEDQFGKYCLAIEPAEARAFIEKRQSRPNASHTERATSDGSERTR